MSSQRERTEPALFIWEEDDLPREVVRRVRSYIKGELRSGRLHRLHPRAPVFLRADRDTGPGFARIFEEAWSELPRRVRVAILDYWRAATNESDWNEPHIALPADVADEYCGLGLEDGRSGEIVQDGGCGMVFHPEVAMWPVEPIASLIAHGLAQVYLLTEEYRSHAINRGDCPYFDPAEDLGAEELVRESEVVALHWGFDPDAWRQQLAGGTIDDW